MANAVDRPECWPVLPLDSWQDTRATLHMWSQIVGKVRLAFTPLVNHWWNVPLYVTANGLTTSRIPYGEMSFELWFDFLRHQLCLETSAGVLKSIPLAPRSVADFYQEVMHMLHSGGIDVKIWHMPVEISDPIPFDQDSIHASYDSEAAEKFWRILLSVDSVFNRFRAEFIGKSSPVHFFWGSFDMAVTRFSGRVAPRLASNSPNLGAWVMQEAYSHEVSSCGFWPGNGGFGKAAFYSYAYPQPPGFASAPMSAVDTYYDQSLGQHILPYDAVRQATSPDDELMRYLIDTYEAAANLGGWEREALERPRSPNRPS
jgi:Family of unknown function (DUF5996)